MPQKTSKQFTYQTRVNVKSSLDEMLTKTASLLSKVERSLFRDFYVKGKNINELKSLYIKKFNITARQFNSLKFKLDGKVKSYKALLDENISRLKSKIKKLKKHLKKIKDPEKLHQKKRRFFILSKKSEKLQKDKKENKIRICFGSKRLFRKQFNLEENGYKTHEDWKKDFDFSRNNSFFIVGSKDETKGNQTCQITRKGKNFSLKLRLPNIFKEKTVILEDITFAYGEEEIIQAIEENEKRALLKKSKNKNYIHYGKAINYLLKKDEKGWRVFVTIEKEKPDVVTRNDTGVIGVDINYNHIAIAETDRFANIIYKKNIPCLTYGKTKNQSLAIITDAAKEIALIAKKRKKPIVLENLDFQKKKEDLREKGNKYSRMLSSFSYSKIISSIETKAFKESVEVLKVNAAFTTAVGRVKFEMRYGLTPHQAAAFVIARRGLNCSERIPRYLEIKNSKNFKTAFFLPAQDRKKHVWSSYRKLFRMLKTADVLHSSTKFRSSRHKIPLRDILDSVFSRGGSGMLIVDRTARSTCLNKSLHMHSFT